MKDKQISPIGDSWEDFRKEVEDVFTNEKTKWGYSLDKHKEVFLLGVNINIGNYCNIRLYGYIYVFI